MAALDLRNLELLALAAQADAILDRLAGWRGTVAQGDDVTLVLLART